MKGFIVSSILSFWACIILYPATLEQDVESKIKQAQNEVDSMFMDELRMSNVYHERAKLLQTQFQLTECLLNQLEFALHLAQVHNNFTKYQFSTHGTDSIQTSRKQPVRH